MADRNTKRPAEPRTYKDVIALEPGVFINYIYQKLPQCEIDMTDEDSIRRAGDILASRANVMIFFTELQARISIVKRSLKRQEEDAETKEAKAAVKRQYEDMVDKEKIMDGAIKALDIQYRSINRILTVYMDSERDRYMPEGKTRRQY